VGVHFEDFRGHYLSDDRIIFMLFKMFYDAISIGEDERIYIRQRVAYTLY